MLARAAITGDVIRWGLVLIGAICVLGLGVWLVRRWSLRSTSSQGMETWSLQDLRDLRAADKITEEEFQALRSQILEMTRGAENASAAETKRPA